MILNTLIAFLVIFGLLAGWVGVQQVARWYAHRHPEFGPAREEGGGCMFCLCKDKGAGGHCAKDQLLARIKKKPTQS